MRLTGEQWSRLGVEGAARLIVDTAAAHGLTLRQGSFIEIDERCGCAVGVATLLHNPGYVGDYDLFEASEEGVEAVEDVHGLNINQAWGLNNGFERWSEFTGTGYSASSEDYRYFKAVGERVRELAGIDA